MTPISLNERILCDILELTLNIPELDLDYLSRITGLDHNSILIFLQNQGYLKKEEQDTKLISNFRINLAIYGIVRLNLQPFEVIKYLNWQEFEEFCLYVLEKHEFKCIKNFRFSNRKKRFEIDILGFYRPYILCIDAKQWRIRQGKLSALKKAVNKQLVRVEALSKVFSKYIHHSYIVDWKYAHFVPLIITSMNEFIKAHNKVPVIPFFQFNNFIANIHGNIEELPQFKARIKNHGVQMKLSFY